MRRLMAVGVLMLLFGSVPVMAQTYQVVARVGLARPGCDGLDETVVEVTNFDPNFHYKVKIEGLSKNGFPGPPQCASGTQCSSDLAHVFTLSPAASQFGTCAFKQYQMPSTSTNPGCPPGCGQTCDNLTVAQCGEAAATCDRPTQWCMSLINFRATITHRSVDGNEPWKKVNGDAGIVIASKGSYGSSPTFAEHSFCNTQTLFQKCSPPPPPPGPPLDE